MLSAPGASHEIVGVVPVLREKGKILGIPGILGMGIGVGRIPAGLGFPGIAAIPGGSIRSEGTGESRDGSGGGGGEGAPG